MTTIREHLAAKAAFIPVPEFTASHLEKQADGTFSFYSASRQLRFDVPEQEVTWVGERYAHACPLPSGYLEIQQRVLKAQLRSQTTHIAVVPAEHGYSNSRDFAVAQMREHLAETKHISDAVAHVDEATGYAQAHMPVEGRKPQTFVRSTLPKKPSRTHTFQASDMDENPADLIDVKEFDRQIAGKLHALVSLSDWDDSLDFAMLKEFDALTACYERLLYNVEKAGKETAAEIERIYREADATGSEIPRQQIERLHRRRQQLRTQYLNFHRKFTVCRQERESVVAASPFSFGPYRSIDERAKMGAQAWAQRKRARNAELDRLVGMSESEYRRWQQDAAYKPRHDGVEDGDRLNQRVAVAGDDLDEA